MSQIICHIYLITFIGILAFMTPVTLDECQCEGCTVELESLFDEDGLIDISTTYDTTSVGDQ